MPASKTAILHKSMKISCLSVVVQTITMILQIAIIPGEICEIYGRTDLAE